PLVVVDVQRAGPSTGMPTKTEQADLNLALFGSHGEAPVAADAARTPSGRFHPAREAARNGRTYRTPVLRRSDRCLASGSDAGLEAARIALTYRTPVVLLTDGYLANGAEPWLLPDVNQLPDLKVEFATRPNSDDGRFLPYLRDPQTLARPWAVPGTPGLEHR